MEKKYSVVFWTSIYSSQSLFEKIFLLDKKRKLTLMSKNTRASSAIAKKLSKREKTCGIVFNLFMIIVENGGGRWSVFFLQFTSFCFNYEAKCADLKYGLQNCVRFFNQKL